MHVSGQFLLQYRAKMRTATMTASQGECKLNGPLTIFGARDNLTVCSSKGRLSVRIRDVYQPHHSRITAS